MNFIEPSDTHSTRDTFTDLIWQIFRLNGALIAQGDVIASAEDLTGARWIALGALANKPKTVAQVANEMELARQSLQRTINWLVEAGLAELIDNPKHRRAKLVRLTEAGQARRMRLMPIQSLWAEEVIDGLSVAELKKTIIMLKRVKDRLASNSYHPDRVARGTDRTPKKD